MFTKNIHSEDIHCSSNYDRLLSLNNVQLTNSARFFIYTVGGIAKHVEPEFCSTGFKLTFSSSPQNFQSHAMNAVFVGFNNFLSRETNAVDLRFGVGYNFFACPEL